MDLSAAYSGYRYSDIEGSSINIFSSRRRKAETPVVFMKSARQVYHAGPRFSLFPWTQTGPLILSVHKPELRLSGALGVMRMAYRLLLCRSAKCSREDAFIPPIRKGGHTAVWCVPPQLAQKNLTRLLDKAEENFKNLFTKFPKFCDTNVKENPNRLSTISLMAALDRAIKKFYNQFKPFHRTELHSWLFLFWDFCQSFAFFNNFLTLPRCCR